MIEYGKNANKRGYYTKNEFLRICLWKSSRQKNNYNDNSNRDIRYYTYNAFKEKDERKRMELLCNLKGVGIPVGSALLTFYQSRKYAVIDKRCVDILRKRYGVKWKHITYDNWVNYLDIIRDISKTLKTTAREVEKGIFAYHRELQFQNDLQNLY